MFQFTRNNQTFKCSPIILEGFDNNNDSSPNIICRNIKSIENFESNNLKLSCSNNQIQVGLSCYPNWLLNNSSSATQNYISKPSDKTVWQPTSISGIQMWLEASDLNSMELFGGSIINKWYDKSGLGNNAIGVNGPTLGKNTVNFTGGNQYFTTNYSAKQAAESVFIIYSVNNNSDVSLVDSSARGGRQFMNLIRNGPSLANNAVEWKALGKYPINVKTQYLGECLYNTSGINIYINGNLNISNSTNPDLNNGLTTIGGSPGQNNFYLNGTISEVIIYDSVLSLEQRQQVEGYLVWKWGLQKQLPANHSFLNAKP